MDSATINAATDGAAADGFPAKRSHRGRWIALVAAIVLLAAGIVTTLEVSFHYAHAKPLELAGGLEWSNTDGTQSRDVEAGPWTSLTAIARPGHAQSFYVMLANNSDVTQTILGLTYPGKDTAEPEDLGVAVPERDSVGDQQDAPDHRYTSAPMSIPPGGIRWVRVTNHTTAERHIWSPGRKEIWTALYLRVRVGAFTRNEVIDLDNFAFTLRGAKRH